MRSVICVGVLTVALGLVGCDRGPDVEKMADGALKSVALDDKVDAKYDQGARVVRLSGTVDSEADKDKAANAVRASIGAQAQVANEVVVQGIQKQAADDLDGGIKERFENLMEHSELDSNDVDLRVNNGVVTLEGTARSDADRTKIESMARSIPGVTQVVNGMKVDTDKHANVADRDRSKTRDRDVRGTSGTRKPGEKR
jgi:osmotically-inducible protein OsmY